LLTDEGAVCVGAWQASACAAGDSAAYHRTPAFADDVVIVA
jgi:acetyl-CoA acyltransferase 1